MARTSYFQNDDLSFEELYKQSIESRPMLNSFGENVLEALRQEYPGRFEDARFELAKPKEEFRAEAKIKLDYNDDCTKAVDLCRAWIVTPNAEEADLARQYVKEHAEDLNFVRVKDRFETPTDTNYRGVFLLSDLLSFIGFLFFLLGDLLGFFGLLRLLFRFLFSAICFFFLLLDGFFSFFGFLDFLRFFFGALFLKGLLLFFFLSFFFLFLADFFFLTRFLSSNSRDFGFNRSTIYTANR